MYAKIVTIIVGTN